MGDETKLMTELAGAFIEALRDFRGTGQDLNPDNFAASLAKQPLVAQLAAPDRIDAATGAAEKELATLKSRYQRATEQKNTVLKHLHEAEEQAAEKEDFYQRSLLTMIRLALGSGQESIDQALTDLKKGLVSGAEVEELDDIVRRLKNEIMQADEAGAGEAKSGSIWSRFFGQDRPDETCREDKQTWLDEFRLAYMDLLGELDIDLGAEYTKRLQTLKLKIAKAEDVEYVVKMRPEVEALVRIYARQVIGERDRAASFIAQVAKRLAEIEEVLTATGELGRQVAESNESFHVDLESHMARLADGSDSADSLESLKDLVVQRLEMVNTAIAEKRTQDGRRQAEIEHELQIMRHKFREVTEEIKRTQAQNRELNHKLQVDPLTGALNRRAYEEMLGREMERFLRHNRAFSVVMVDIDHFKKVNDTYGHQVGDACLKEVVNRIGPVLRKNDRLARYGGEEFIVLLPETDRTEAFQVAEKIRREIDLTEFMVRGKGLPVTISLGVAEVSSDDLTSETVVGRADKALYRAKENGRNRVEAG